MNADTQALRDDLAFLRALVQAGDETPRGFAEGYFAAGLIYFGQVVLQIGIGLIAASNTLAQTVAGLAPTVVFAIVIAWILARHRSHRPTAQIGKTIAAVFGVAGLSNLALVAVIGSIAWRERSMTIWLIYPCAVFVLQGAAWLVAYALRRRTWLAATAGLWFACGIGMALMVETLLGYAVFCGLGLFFGMVVPGWVMMRSATKTA